MSFLKQWPKDANHNKKDNSYVENWRFRWETEESFLAGCFIKQASTSMNCNIYPQKSDTSLFCFMFQEGFVVIEEAIALSGMKSAYGIPYLEVREPNIVDEFQ